MFWSGGFFLCARPTEPVPLGNLPVPTAVHMNRVTAKFRTSIGKGVVMETIVEYSTNKKPRNAYPKRIISPFRPHHCCAVGMITVGRVQEDERGFPFYYRRCRDCGFTLRYFLPIVPPDRPPLVQNRAGLS